MSLFSTGVFVSHSGLQLGWKIDCDWLSDADIATLARLVGERFRFGRAVGIPTGGYRLAEALQPYCRDGGRLLVDDVLTTGKSMLAEHKRGDIGVVIFARTRDYPAWIHPIFQLEMR